MLEANSRRAFVPKWIIETYKSGPEIGRLYKPTRWQRLKWFWWRLKWRWQ